MDAADEAKYEYLIAKYKKDLRELNKHSVAIKKANESALKDVASKKHGRAKMSRGKKLK